MSKKRPDFMEQLRAAEEKKQQAQQGPDPGRVTKRGRYRKHGQYWQVTFRLPLDYVDGIEALSDRHPSLSKEDLKRWVVGVGLQAYLDGARPGEVLETTARADLPEVEL